MELKVTVLNSPVSVCSNLKKRGWLGQIDIDDMAGKLIIRVKAEGAKTAHQDLKTLSGGERSFITICFLLALGKQLQASFHCLDEFDVFMDSVSQGVRCCLCIGQLFLSCCTLSEDQGMWAWAKWLGLAVEHVIFPSFTPCVDTL